MNRAAAALIAILVAASSLLVATPAQAAAFPEILSPSSGSTVQQGHTQYRIRISDDSAGLYTLKARSSHGCVPAYSASRTLSHPGGNATYTVTLPRPSCRADGFEKTAHFDVDVVSNTDPTHKSSDYFYVKLPDTTPSIRSFSLDRKVIFPHVKDGYKDDLSIDWEGRSDVSTLDHTSRADILNRSGRIVASKRKGYSDGYWTWDGKSKGKTVPVGTYRVRVTITNRDGKSVQAIRPFRVKRDTKIMLVERSKVGWDSSRDKTRGNCHIDPDFYDDTQRMDCWGGNYAEATYVFRIPKNARKPRFVVDGETGCCNRGKYSEKGKRVSKTKYEVTVRITNWRAFTVHNVYLDYRARVRR